MALVSHMARWNIAFLLAFTSLAIATSNAQGHSCPMPSNLDASNVAYNTITFRWDVTKYIPNPVHCTCMSSGNYGEACSASNTPKICTTGVAGYTRTQSSLGVYTNYTMCVQTQCSNSNFSTAVCRTFRTSPLAPSQPYQIFATKHSPSSLDVSWRYPTALNGPLDGYRIRWCQATNCVPSQEILPVHGTRNFRVTGLQPYRQYNVYVAGFNVDPHSGQTLYGAEASLSEYTLPTYPSEPSLSFTKVSTSQVNVVVGVPKYTNGPINGYVLTWCPKLRCYGDYVNTREIAQSNAGTQSVTGLQPWTEYEFTVRAFNTIPTDSQRAYSEEVKGTVVPMPFSPSGPQNFKATPLSATSVKLTWDLPPRYDLTPTHFRLFWCTGGDKTCFNVDVGNVREGIISPLAPYTEYRFMIKALVQFTSPWLNSAVSSTSVRTWPGDPSRPVDLQVVRTKATAVDVSWKAPLDPAGPTTGYRVRICPELGTCPAIGLVSRHKTLNKNVHNHSFFGLEPYAQYQVQVSAFNSLPDEKTAEGDVAVVSVSTTPSEPSEPTNLTVQTISSSVLLVTWQPPSHKNGPVKGYNVSWWKTSHNATHGVDEVTTTSSNFVKGEASSITISDLLPYTTYAVRVARVNVDGNTTLEGAAAHGEGITDPEPSPPPVDLTVEAVKINGTVSRLSCSWSPPNTTGNLPVEGYQLQVCMVQNASTCWDGNTTAEQLSYVVEAVPNFEDYVVTVNAYVLNHGRVVVGEAATATASTAAPEIPVIASVNATAVNATTIYVEWKPVDSVNELEIEYNATVLSAYGEEVSQVFVSDSRVVFTELQAWTSYTVQVSACVKRGSKRQCGSATTVVVRTSLTESSMPTSVRTTTNGTAIHVTWEEPLHPNGPLIGYSVTWWLNNATLNDSNGSAELPKNTTFLKGPVASHVIDELQSPATYVIEVRRVNENNYALLEGAAARVEASTTPNSYPPPQNAKFTIRRVNASHFAINLTWQPPHKSVKVDIERYELFIQRIEEDKSSVVFTVNAVTPGYLFEVSDMNPFVEYIVQIRAYVRFGNTVVKGEAAEVRINVDARHLLVVSNVEVKTSGEGVAVVSWQSSVGINVASSNTTTYEVKLISTETEEGIEGIATSSLQATFTGLKLRTNYTARVKACDIRGHVRKCGNVSEARFQTPKEDATPRPTDFSVVAVNSTALKVTWEMPALSREVVVTEFRILWWPSATKETSESAADGHTRIHFASANETTFVITGLEAYKSYDVEIVVFYVENSAVKNVSIISKSKTAPKPFAPPTKVTFAISGDVDELTRVSISWEPPTHLTGPRLQGYYVDVCPIVTSSKSPSGAVCKRHNTTSTTFVTALEGLNRFEAYTVFVSAYTAHQGVVIIGKPEETFVTTDPTPQLKVDGIKLEVLGNDSLKISWTGVGLSASRWRAVYTVRVMLKSTGDQVFEKEVSTAEVNFTDFKKEEYAIHIEACIVRGGVKNCGRPNTASVQRSAFVQENKQVSIQTVNSTAIAVILSQHAEMEPTLTGFKISWSASKPDPNDTSHGESGAVFLPPNATSFTIDNLISFEAYNVQVTKIFTDGSSQWEAVAARSETVTDPEPFAKPTGVVFESSSSGGNSSLVVNWNAPTSSSDTPVEGYIVSICPRHETPEGTGACHTYKTSASSLHVDASGLRSFTEYAVEITAYVTINGRAIKGETIRMVTVTSPPPIPAIENPVVSNTVEGTSVKVSWSHPQTLTEYDVVYEVALTEEASGRVLSKTEMNATQTTFENLDVSTEYTVSIIVCLVSGSQRKCGNASAILFKTASKDVPKEPIHLHIKAINSSALVVTWPAPLTNATPFEGYVVTWWKQNETFQEEKMTYSKALPVDRTSFVINDLDANTTYHVNVSRVYKDSDADRMDSEEMLASTQLDPYLKPTGLRAEYKVNSSQVIVTWDAFPVRIEDSPVLGYITDMCVTTGNSTNVEFEYCDQRNVSAGLAEAVFTEVEGLTDYRIDVRAVVSRSDNTSDEGEPAFVYIRTPAPPLPDLRHTLHADVSATSATLFWRRPVGFDDYEVIYHVSAFSASSQLKIDRTTNLTELTFQGLEPGANYSVEVDTCLIRRQRRHCAGNTTMEFKTLPVDSTDYTPEVSVKALNTSALEVRWLRHHIDSKTPEEYSVSWRPKRSNRATEVETRKISFPPGYHGRELVINDLQPYTAYTVYVTSSSNVRKDHFILTLTTGQGTTSPLPSDPPENLTLDVLTEDASVKTLVTWNPPMHTGGAPITGYLVVVCPVRDAATVAASRAKPGCESRKTTPDVKKTIFLQPASTGRDYVVEVRAFVEHDCHTIEGQVAIAMSRVK
ncbi:phosphatidylinositol phosphatase PTPRQ isoform X2 [Rhipicephalus sanguineus]|uniref:phosphatidylinositol phosphatase PTPRQ isoform X2 n=1 Tax=Rhipicephalus sanguineus TaxID=34632 RepID=UPI0020C4A1E6|nr:phosphatidylinositol phosphatase PTPRQ isoform X2 [Rhipicephalus sanguineus]